MRTHDKNNNVNQTTHETERHHHNSAERDRMEGGLTQAKGRIKESCGALTGNEQLKAEGAQDQMVGTARQKKGRLKDHVKAWIDHA